MTSETRELRRSAYRFRTDFGWLQSRHSFSFGGHHDPERMGFGPLRVINDDVIAPGTGFDMHGHRDMEILTWVLSGAVRHEDSAGHSGVIGPGELQAMSAGRGIRHSEWNASETAPLHLLQIWIEPRARGLSPSYAERSFDASGRDGRWQEIAGPAGTSGLAINQDARVLVAEVGDGASVTHEVGAGRLAYLHVATGSVVVDGEDLGAGDALAVTASGVLTVSASGGSGQVLLFDLPL